MTDYYDPGDYYGKMPQDDEDDEGLIIDERAPIDRSSSGQAMDVHNTRGTNLRSSRSFDPIVQEYYTEDYQEEEEGEYLDSPERPQRSAHSSPEKSYKAKDYDHGGKSSHHGDYRNSGYDTQDYKYQDHHDRQEPHEASRDHSHPHTSSYRHDRSSSPSYHSHTSTAGSGQSARNLGTVTPMNNRGSENTYALGIASETDPIVKLMGNMEEEEEGEVADDDDDKQEEDHEAQDDLWDDAIKIEGGEEDWSMLQGATNLYLDDEDTVPVHSQDSTAHDDIAGTTESFDFWKRCKICLLSFKDKQDFLVHLHGDAHKSMLVMKTANLPPALQRPLKPLKPLIAMTESNGRFLLRLSSKKGIVGFCLLCNANIGYGSKAQKRHLQGKRHNKMYLSELSQHGPEYFFDTYGNVPFGDPTLKGNAMAWRSDREKTPFVVYAMRCGFYTSYECKVCLVQYRASWDWRYHLRTMEHIVKTRASITKMGEEGYRRIMFDVPSEMHEASFGGQMESVFSYPLDIQQPLSLKTEMRWAVSGKIGVVGDAQQVWMHSRQEYLEIQQKQIRQEQEEEMKIQQAEQEKMAQEQQFMQQKQQEQEQNLNRQLSQQSEQEPDNAPLWQNIQKQWNQQHGGSSHSERQNNGDISNQQQQKWGQSQDVQDFTNQGQWSTQKTSGDNVDNVEEHLYGQQNYRSSSCNINESNIQQEDAQQGIPGLDMPNTSRQEQWPNQDQMTQSSSFWNESKRTDNYPPASRKESKSTLLTDLTSRIRQLMAQTKNMDNSPQQQQILMMEMMQLMEQQQELMMKADQSSPIALSGVADQDRMMTNKQADDWHMKRENQKPQQWGSQQQPSWKPQQKEDNSRQQPPESEYNDSGQVNPAWARLQASLSQDGDARTPKQQQPDFREVWSEPREQEQHLGQMDETDELELFMQNIPVHMDREALKKVLMKYGVVTKCKVKSKNDRSSGTAFVKMESRTSCERVIQELNGRPLSAYSAPLNVIYALRRTQNHQGSNQPERRISSDSHRKQGEDERWDSFKGDQDLRHQGRLSNWNISGEGNFNTQSRNNAKSTEMNMQCRSNDTERQSRHYNWQNNNDRRNETHLSLGEQPLGWTEERGHVHERTGRRRSSDTRERMPGMDNEQFVNSPSAGNNFGSSDMDMRKGQVLAEQSAEEENEEEGREMPWNRRKMAAEARDRADFSNLLPVERQLLQKLGPEAFRRLRENPMARNMMISNADPNIVETLLLIMTRIGPEALQQLEGTDLVHLRTLAEMDPLILNKLNAGGLTQQQQLASANNMNPVVAKLMDQGISPQVIQLLMHSKCSHQEQAPTGMGPGIGPGIGRNEGLGQGMGMNRGMQMGQGMRMDEDMGMGRRMGPMRPQGSRPRGMNRGGMGGPSFRGRGDMPRPQALQRGNIPSLLDIDVQGFSGSSSKREHSREMSPGPEAENKRSKD